MSFWDTVRGWFNKDRQHSLVVPISPERSDGAAPPSAKLFVDRSYFRLRLAEMFLSKEVAAMRKWVCAVQSVVKLSVGGKPAMEIPFLLDSSQFGQASADGHRDGVIIRDKALTPTLPFSGELLDLSVALLAIGSTNYLDNFFQILGGFAKLLAVPQFSSALALAQPLTSGIQALYGAGNGHLHLALSQSYGDGELSSGYYAIIRATQQDLKGKFLCVVQNQLRVGENPVMDQTEPFEGYDYMLLRFEVFDERKDWPSLAFIDEPFKEAVKSLDPTGQDNARADDHIRTAMRAALVSPELTRADRRRVVDQLVAYYKDAKEKMQVKLLQPSSFTLEQVMRNAEPTTESLNRPAPTLEDVIRVGQ